VKTIEDRNVCFDCFFIVLSNNVVWLLIKGIKCNYNIMLSVPVTLLLAGSSMEVINEDKTF
jgi:hypothetical protein